MANLTNQFQLNDGQFKEYLTNSWLERKDYFSEGATPEELVNYTQPTEGDLECLVESLLDECVFEDYEYKSLFELRLNQALRLFGYTK
jgi:hypothetical protein